MRYFLVASFLAFVSLTSAQTTLYGNLRQHLENTLAAMPGPGTNVYNDPTTFQYTTWKNLIQKIVVKNYTGANTSAQIVDYKLYTYFDTTTTPAKKYYLLERDSAGTNYWGTYVFADSCVRPYLCLEAPHAMHDVNTSKEAWWCFRYLDAGMFAIAGTHQCNNSTAGTCSGKTDICTSPNVNVAFRISDVSHTTTNIFYATTEAIYTNLTNSVLVHFHGFTQGVGDPDVILGNGTRFIPPGTDYCMLLKNALLTLEPTLNFKISHMDSAYMKGASLWDTHGRYLNNSSNPCKFNSTTPTGRFIHIDQEFTKLRSDSTGWDLMAHGLEITFPLSVPLPLQLIHFYARKQNDNARVAWTANEWNDDVDFYLLEHSADGINYSPIYNAHPTNSPGMNNYSYTHTQPMSGTNHYRLTVFSNLHEKTTYYAKVNMDVVQAPITAWIDYQNQTIMCMMDGDRAMDAHISLFDIHGHELCSNDIAAHDGIWRVNIGSLQLPPGLIIVRAIVNNEVKSARLLYQRD